MIPAHRREYDAPEEDGFTLEGEERGQVVAGLVQEPEGVEVRDQEGGPAADEHGDAHPGHVMGGIDRGLDGAQALEIVAVRLFGADRQLSGLMRSFSEIRQTHRE